MKKMIRNSFLWMGNDGNKYISALHFSGQCYFDKVDENLTSEKNDGNIYGVSYNGDGISHNTQYNITKSKEKLAVNYNHIPDVTGIMITSAETEQSIPINIINLNPDFYKKEILYVRVTNVPTTLSPNGMFEDFIHLAFIGNRWMSNHPYPNTEYSGFDFVVDIDDGDVSFYFGIPLK